MSDKQWFIRREPTAGGGLSVSVVEVVGGVVALVKACGGRKEQNARLIAAAPDMLAALIAITKRYEALAGSGDCGSWDYQGETEVVAARAAIAKATGA